MLVLQILGGTIGLLTHIPLFIGIYRNKIKQNYVTWMLWSLIDTIVSITTILEFGNFWLPLGYATGAILIAILLFIKKEGDCKRFEIFTIFLVIICLIIWCTLGNRATITVSIFAIVLSSIPQIVETIKKPSCTPTILYIIFGVADLLSLIGGKNWSIEERVYSSSELILSFIIIFLSVRKENKNRY